MTKTDNNATFLLRVNDDSMAPEFRQGDQVLIDPELAPESGDYVITRSRDGLSKLAQLTEDKGALCLKHKDTTCPATPLGAEHVVGVVVKHHRTFR